MIYMEVERFFFSSGARRFSGRGGGKLPRCLLVLFDVPYNYWLSLRTIVLLRYYLFQLPQSVFPKSLVSILHTFLFLAF